MGRFKGCISGRSLRAERSQTPNCTASPREHIWKAVWSYASKIWLFGLYMSPYISKLFDGGLKRMSEVLLMTDFILRATPGTGEI